MIDIVTIEADLGLFDTQSEKAANILSIQLGSLEYAPTFGVDIKYFLSEDFIFQNASFRAYLIEVLANNGINVAGVMETIENLFSTFTFELKPPETKDGSLVAR